MPGVIGCYMYFGHLLKTSTVINCQCNHHKEPLRTIRVISLYHHHTLKKVPLFLLFTSPVLDVLRLNGWLPLSFSAQITTGRPFCVIWYVNRNTVQQVIPS